MKKIEITKSTVVILFLCGIIIALLAITVMQHGEIRHLTNTVSSLSDDVEEAQSASNDAKDAAEESKQAAEQTQEDVEDLKNK